MHPRFAALLAVALVASAAFPPSARASHPVLTSTVVQADLIVPWDVAFAPDGRMLVTERPGRVRIYADGTPGAPLLGTTEVPYVRSEHESGVNGIAVDVDFAEHPYVYVCAARDPDGVGAAAPWVNEVIRYELTADHALVDPTVLLTGAAAATQHNGCPVEMDASGMLWVGIGDGAVAARAQDPASLNGKILRVARDGSVPLDNPILAGALAPTVVYSLGHRNPQGIAFAPDGSVYAAEHGPNVDDEINRIVAGGNYGWPCYTGAGNAYQTAGCAPAEAYHGPAWASGGSTIATSNLTFLSHPSWESWQGSAVTAQLKEQDLRRLVPSSDGATLAPADILLDGRFGRLRATVLAPDGALYLTTSNGSGDRVIRVTPGPVVVDRLAGPDRYATAAAVSRDTFAPGVPVVYVATGLGYADALTGGAAAARRGVPVLLVTTTGIPAATHDELLRLAPQRIVVLGSTGVVSASVEAQLAAYAPGGVTRLWGRDRYETAAAISRDTFAPHAPVAYVATGLNFPDALAGVPAAGVEGGPILLVRPDAVPDATRSELERLRPGRIVILGSAGVVGDGVAAELQQLTLGGVARRAGADRYATALAVSRVSFGPRTAQVFVATGLNYPDGLAGGPAAARLRGPLLLVPGSSLPAAVAGELTRLDPDRVTLLGSDAVVSETIRTQIEALLNP